MADYTAPLRDMRFALTELADLAGVIGLPGYEDAAPDLVDAILEEAGKFAGAVLSPLNATGDRQGARLTGAGVVAADGFADAYRQFTENGWAAVTGDPEYGGQGLPDLVGAVDLGDVELRQHGLRAVPAADHGRGGGDPGPRLGRAEGEVSAEHDRRQLDRHDESDRTAGRLRPRRGAHPGRSAKAITT